MSESESGATFAFGCPLRKIPFPLVTIAQLSCSSGARRAVHERATLFSCDLSPDGRHHRLVLPRRTLLRRRRGIVALAPARAQCQPRAMPPRLRAGRQFVCGGRLCAAARRQEESHHHRRQQPPQWQFTTAMRPFAQAGAAKLLCDTRQRLEVAVQPAADGEHPRAPADAAQEAAKGRKECAPRHL